MPARARRVGLWLLLITACVGLGWELSRNFHTIIPEQIYRSGQLNGDSLERQIAAKQLRSILNLRGANPGDSWYEDECALAARHGIRHFDLPLDSLTPPTGADLQELIELLDACPRPLLIHCCSGIDRSGIVAAICLLLYDGSATPHEARSQLGLRFGHFPWQENQAKLEDWMQRYEAWLADKGWQHNPRHFREWAEQR